MTSKPKLIALDVESTGLSWFRGDLYSLALAWLTEKGEERSAVWKATELPAQARALLADPAVPKVGHRVRFDLKWLISNGVPVEGRTHCTKLMQHLLDENRPNGLKDLVREYFGASALKDEGEMKALLKELKLKHVGELCALELREPDPAIRDVILRYNREDAINTLRLYGVLSKKLQDFDSKVKRVCGVSRGPKDYYFKETLPSEKALLDLELGGIYLGAEELTAYGEEIRAVQNDLLERLGAHAAKEIDQVRLSLLDSEKAKRKTLKGKAAVPKPEFNWASGQHLGMLLYEQLRIPARYTASGNYETAEGTLKQIAESTKPGSVEQRLLAMFAEYKKLQKERNTYVGDADSGLLSHRAANGRVYAEYHPFIDTGRLGSANPNMQNLPRGSRCKAAFKPEPGQVFIYADYSQVELRIAAHLSQDPAMVEAFNLGLDLHRMTASALFGVAEKDVTPDQRQKGKTCNFLLIYDGGPRRLQEEMPEFSVETCKLFKARYFERYPRYREFLSEVLEAARRRLLLVSEAGRTRRLPDLALGDWLKWGRWDLKRAPQELTARLGERLQKQGLPLTEDNYDEAAGKAFSHAKKQAFNFPVQSLGASITKSALVALRAAGLRVVTTVHDSIVVGVEAAKAGAAADQVKQLLEDAYKLTVPLKVDMKILTSLSESDKWEGLKLVTDVKKIA